MGIWLRAGEARGPVVWRPSPATAVAVTRDAVMATIGGTAGAHGGAAGSVVAEAIDREVAVIGAWLKESFLLARRLPLNRPVGEKRPRLEGLGPVVGPAGAFDGADNAFVLLATVGAGLEAEVAARFSRGEVVEGMVLDAVGTVLLGALTESFLDEVDSEVPVGLLLQPGCHSLAMNLQERIFPLLDAAHYGLGLTEGLMLRPAKSVTSVVPAGQSLVARRGQVVLCDLCNMREKCRYRVFDHLTGGGRH